MEKACTIRHVVGQFMVLERAAGVYQIAKVLPSRGDSRRYLNDAKEYAGSLARAEKEGVAESDLIKRECEKLRRVLAGVAKGDLALADVGSSIRLLDARGQLVEVLGES
jgi:hypothetical protein